MQCAYIHGSILQENVRTVAFQNGTSQSIEDNYIDGLIGELKLAR